MKNKKLKYGDRFEIREKYKKSYSAYVYIGREGRNVFGESIDIVVTDDKKHKITKLLGLTPKEYCEDKLKGLTSLK